MRFKIKKVIVDSLWSTDGKWTITTPHEVNRLLFCFFTSRPIEDDCRCVTLVIGPWQLRVGWYCGSSEPSL